MVLLRWSFRVFPGCQDSYDPTECHGLCDLGRHKEPPYHTDSAIPHRTISQITILFIKQTTLCETAVVFTQITARNSYLSNPENP